ncbi:MAG: hypothetical protein OEN23_00935, partial [Paracoccaceae bacterium]|nr:hypothetical protein [Paracoccaceae bacterium]
MAGKSLGRRSDELLFERERQGVVTLTIVRGIFVAIVAATVWIIGVSPFEKIATTAIVTVVLLAIGVSLFLLTRRIAVGQVGLAGCAIDIAVLATLPVIWYVSVGGTAVEPAYMLKTQITVVALGIVVLNALAFRPLYPILTAAGGIFVHLALLAFVLRDPRTVLSSDFVDSAMGSALSLELVLVSMIIIAAAGGALGYLTLIARRTVAQGVALEVANAQISRYFSPGVVSRIADEADALLGVGGRNQD